MRRDPIHFCDMMEFHHMVTQLVGRRGKRGSAFMHTRVGKCFVTHIVTFVTFGGSAELGLS